MTADLPDSIVRSLDPALVVVTTAAGGERAGCLVGFHAQSSIDPLRYAVWLSKANHTYRVALRATHVGIHFLAARDGDLAELFGTRTGDDLDKFAELATQDGPGRVPVLTDLPNRLAARLTAIVDERGDHVCVVTEPVEISAGRAFEPLRLSQAAHLNPGHSSEERNSPPTERSN